MRWLFLLLVVLNVVYGVWHQQGVPQRGSGIQALSLTRNTQQDIRLLSETGVTPQPAPAQDCLYLGGYPQRTALLGLEQRLAALGVQDQAQAINGDQGAVHWLRIDPQSRRLLDDSALESLVREFNELKHQIMPCEGIATSE
jgi:hypothetical protein